MKTEFTLKANIDADISKAQQKIEELSTSAKKVSLADPTQEMHPMTDINPAPSIFPVEGLNQQTAGNTQPFSGRPQEVQPVVEKSVQSPSPFGEPSNMQSIWQEQVQSQTEMLTNANSAFGGLIDNLAQMNELMPAFVQHIRGIIADAPKHEPTSSKTGKDKEKMPEWAKKMKEFGLIPLAATGVAAYYEHDASMTRRRTRALDADVFGVEQEKASGRANMQKNLVSGAAAATTIASSFIPGVGPLLGMIAGKTVDAVGNAIVSGVSNATAAKIAEQERQSQIYQTKLPALEKSLVWYDTPASDALTNRAKIENLNTFWTQKARNTGLSIEEFTEHANSLSAFGDMSRERAGSITHNAATMARFTGSDVGSLVDFMGSRVRFGSNDATRDLERAYAYSRNAGMGKGQFTEFLDGLQSAVEQGIAKGYTASTEDISKQMMMFSKLSGGDAAWEGKYGFQKLSQINNGLAGATALSSTGHNLAFQSLYGIVAKNGNEKGLKGGAFIQGQDALNTLSLMEAGLNPDSFRAIAGTMKNLYGDDVMSQVGAWKELSGLNYTGAMRLYQMANSGELDGLSDKQIQDKIKDLENNKEFQSDSTNIMNSVNRIKEDVMKISQNGLKVYMAGLNDLEQTQGKERRKMEVKELHNEDYIQKFLNDTFEIDDKSQNKHFSQSLKNMLAGSQDDLHSNAERQVYDTFDRIHEDKEITKQEIQELIQSINDLIKYHQKYLHMPETVVITSK